MHCGQSEMKHCSTAPDTKLGPFGNMRRVPYHAFCLAKMQRAYLRHGGDTCSCQEMASAPAKHVRAEGNTCRARSVTATLIHRLQSSEASSKDFKSDCKHRQAFALIANEPWSLLSDASEPAPSVPALSTSGFQVSNRSFAIVARRLQERKASLLAARAA